VARPDELHRNFGRIVRSLREERELTQERLADASGVTRNYVSEIERGLKSPSLRVIAGLARALGTRPSELISAAERS
jgi:transcriptional regulator with XRE-family HTH domain